MSKFLKVVSKVAGVVASVAQFVPVIGQKIALIAGAVSAVTGTLAQITAKPPRAVGQVTNITVGANQPIPYMIGRSYSGGALIHDVGYGGVVSDVDNPYRAMTMVYSGCGPIHALVAVQADFANVGFSGTAATGYYSGFLWRDWLDGTGPAPRALAAQFAGEPGWSAAHKLSGFFGIKYTLKFDKKGKVWQAGVPQFGVIADGVRAYDPRFDSTRPGGAGTQRIDNEATWTFTKNPALHALTYAYGRYQNGKKVFGVDLGEFGVDIASAVAFANLCDANGWEANGSIYEPGDKWNNLKLICEAGGGVPVPGARLRFDFNAAGVSVDTITIHDLADGEISLPVTQGYASRLNTVQGVYTSPAHRWEPVPTDKIVDTAALAADGEEKADQFPFQMVTAKNQAAQLAAYKMANSRELGPIVIPVKARLLTYPVGTFLTAQLPPIGLAAQKVKIIGKRRTMEDGSGELTVISETDAKHAFALAATSGAPPASVLVPPETLDTLAISLAMPVTSRTPTIRPVAPVEGHIWYDIDDIGHQFSGQTILHRGDPILFRGVPITSSGYSRVRDVGVEQSLVDASNAQAAADAAQEDATDAINRLVAIDDDGVIDISEKVSTLIPEDATLEGSYTTLIASAAVAGVSTSAAAAARTAWLSLRNALSPAWNDVSSDSPVARGSYDATLNAYRDALAALTTAIIEAMTLAKQISTDIVGGANKTIAADYTGAVTGAYPTFAPSVLRNGASIKSDTLVTYTATKLSDGSSGADGGTISLSSSGSSKGDVTPSAFNSGSSVIQWRLTISYNGTVVGKHDCTLTKALSGPPTSSNKIATRTADQSQSTTTYAIAHSAAAPQLVVASGEKLYVSGGVSYGVSGGNRSGTFKNQYSSDGSSWTDFGSAITGSGAVAGRYIGEEWYDEVPGSVNLAQNVTPSAGTYYVRTVFVISATGQTITLFGEITFEAKP
jgi:hypothetical protein